VGNLSNKTDERAKKARRTHRTKFYAVESAALSKINTIMSIFDHSDYVKNIRGFVGVTKKETPNSRELRIIDRNGRELLKISSDFSSETTLLKTDAFLLFHKSDEQVKLSEYALGVEGALSEILFTPEGKLVSERLDAVTSISKSLTPIDIDDSGMVRQIISEAIKEITPRIPSRTPWGKTENILDLTFNNIEKSAFRSKFEKIVRSSIR
jgi:hypothetical protein